MIAVGQTLGNYRIVSKIGSGGMGAVYLAEHPLIGKKVALKVIHRDLSQNREVITRFFNEARAVNQIGNEHIVDISDFGQTAEGEYFFIMELLNGRCLGDVLEQERVLSPQRALHVAAQVADALAASHAVGIIHRDLKPDNIFLVPKMGEVDFVKLLDFGLAKLVDNTKPSLTKQGVILGTPQYMAPEQCESKAQVDHRADVYALGVLLFQMTTGTLPYDGNSMGEILVKHVAHPIPIPRAVNPNVPPAVEQIIMRCMAKRADERFQTMGELRAALLDPDRWVQGRPLEWSPPPPPPGGGGQATGMMRPLANGGTGPSSVMVTQQNLAPPPPSALAHERSGAHPAYVPGPPRAALAVPVPASQGTLVLDAKAARGERTTGPGPAIRPRSHRWIVATVFVVLAGGLGTAGILWVKRLNAEATIAAPPEPAPAPPPAKTADDSGAVAVAAAEPAPLPTPAPVPKPIVEPIKVPMPPAPPPAPEQVKILLTSDPAGADVIVEASGVSLGQTPLELSFPPGSEHVLVFQMSGHEPKRRVIKATSDTEIGVMLEKKRSRRKKVVDEEVVEEPPPPDL